MTLLLRGSSKTICHFAGHFYSVYSVLSLSPETKEETSIEEAGSKHQIRFSSLWSVAELTREEGAHIKDENNGAETLWPDSAQKTGPTGVTGLC